MVSYKVQRVCKIHCPKGLIIYYHLKGSVIHWIEGTEYHRFDIESNSALAMIELPTSYHLVSVGESEIEAAHFECRKVRIDLLSLDPVRIIDSRIVECDTERVIIPQNLGSLCLRVTPSYNTSGPIDIIALSRYEPNRRIDIQEGYTFKCILSSQRPLLDQVAYTFNGSQADQVTLWSKDDTYYLLDQHGMRSTGITSKLYPVILLENNLFTLSPRGLLMNGSMIATGDWGTMAIIGEGYILDEDLGTVYRIKNTEDGSTRSYVNRD